MSLTNKNKKKNNKTRRKKNILFGLLIKTYEYSVGDMIILYFIVN